MSRRGFCRPPSRGSCSTKRGHLAPAGRSKRSAPHVLAGAEHGRYSTHPPSRPASARERFQQAREAAADSLPMAAPAARPGPPHVPALPVGRRRLLRCAAPRSRGARAGRALHGLCKHSAVSATAAPGPAVTPRPALTCESLPRRPAAGRTADDVLQDRGRGGVRAGPNRARPGGAATTPGAHQHGARAPPGHQLAGRHAEPSPLHVRLRALGLRVLHDEKGSVLLREARVQLAAPAALHAGRQRLRSPAGPYADRPPPNPAALPAAAILPRAHWRARPARPALLPGRRGGGPGGTGTGTRQEGTGTSPECRRRRAPSCAARSASPREPSTDKERRVFRPRSSLKGECSDLSLTEGQGAAEVRTGCRVRPGKCPRGALPIPFSSEVHNSSVLGAPRTPDSHHRVLPFLDITGE